MPTEGRDRLSGLVTMGRVAEQDDRQKQLRDLLVRCRIRAELTQEDAAELLGVSLRAYGDFERGVIQRHTPAFLGRVAVVLQMTEQERLMLYYLTTGQQPLATNAAERWLSPHLAVLNASSLPGFIYDGSWDICGCNAAFVEIWDEEDMPTNAIDLILLNEEARERYLMNWADGWAVPFLRQVTAARLQVPQEKRLNRLYGVVEEATRTDPDLAAVWERARDDEFVHPHGAIRHLRDRRGRETTVTLLLSRRLERSRHRIGWFVPSDQLPGRER